MFPFLKYNLGFIFTFLSWRNKNNVCFVLNKACEIFITILLYINIYIVIRFNFFSVYDHRLCKLIWWIEFISNHFFFSRKFKETQHLFLLCILLSNFQCSTLIFNFILFCTTTLHQFYLFINLSILETLHFQFEHKTGLSIIFQSCENYIFYSAC